MGPIIGYALIYRRNAHHLSCAMQKMPYNFVVRCVVHVQLIVRADRDSSSALARVCVFLPDGSATETMIVETCLMNRTAVSSLLTSLYCCRHQFIPCPAFSVVSLPLRLEWNNGSYIPLQTTVAGYCLLYTSPSPRDRQKSRMPSSA